MLLTLLLACVPGRPEAYADCVVTVVTMDGEGTLVQEVTYVHDGEGRVVAEHLVLEPDSLNPGGGVGDIVSTYVGGCEVRTRVDSFAPGYLYTNETRRVCDAHGHLEREESETAWERGGEAFEWGASDAYENEHDAQERLTAVTHWTAGAEDPGMREDYEWAAPCDEPAETRYTINGFRVTETRVCRLDGRGLEGAREALDEEGTSVEYYRWRRDYDVGGRLVAEEYDQGQATDIYQRTTYTWGDGAAPGPTEAVSEYEGEVAWVVSYTYDCAG